MQLNDGHREERRGGIDGRGQLLLLGGKGGLHLLGNTIVTEIITKLIRKEFSPVMFLSKITELIVGEFSSGNSLQDFVHGISVRVSWDR